MPGQPLLAALLIALAGTLCACSSPGAAQGSPAAATVSNRRVVVGLYDSRGEVRLDLANASHPELADAYSRQRADATLKLAPDELMEELLRDLDRRAFESLATPGAPPEPGPAVRGWVTVQDDAARHTFVVPASGATGEQLTAFANMKLLINEFYMHVGGLQFVTNPEGHRIFKERP